jgi:uncharacterized RDD family membrane protein YckC
MTVVPASYGSRVGAYLIDGIIPFVLFLPSLVAFISANSMIASGDFQGAASASGAGSALEFVAVFANLAYGIGLWIAEATTGMTIGKRALGLRTVRSDTLQLAGFGRIVGRYLIIALGGVVIIGQYIILLSPLWDSEHRNRGWHDKAANTWVLDVKRGPNPLLAGSPTALPAAVPAAAASIVSVGIPSTGSGPLPTNSDPVPVGIVAAQPDPVPTHAFEEPLVAPIEQTPLPLAAKLTMPATSTSTEPASGVIVGVPGFAPLHSAPAPEQAASSFQSGEVSSGTVDEEDNDRTRAANSSELTPRGAVLRLDSGDEFPFAGTTLVGRNPASDPGEEQVGLISIPDTTRSLSKTHAEIGIEGFRLWATDRNSTNGTRVRRLDGTEQTVTAAERVYFAPGETVLLGDRAFEVRWQS